MLRLVVTSKCQPKIDHLWWPKIDHPEFRLMLMIIDSVWSLQRMEPAGRPELQGPGLVLAPSIWLSHLYHIQTSLFRPCKMDRRKAARCERCSDKGQAFVQNCSWRAPLILYLDTSSLVKLYIAGAHPGNPGQWALLLPKNYRAAHIGIASMRFECLSCLEKHSQLIIVSSYIKGVRIRSLFSE